MIKIAKIDNDNYQIDNNEIPINITDVRNILTSYAGLTDIQASNWLDELDNKKENTIEEKFANKGVVVNMYEVEYNKPQDPNKETQEIAKHLDEYENFVSQIVYPDTETEDVVVDLRKNLEKNKISQNLNWRQQLLWNNPSYKAGNPNQFFSTDTCDRCKEDLKNGRTMSWFNDDTICMKCSEKEREYKNKLEDKGQSLEGSGRLPIELQWHDVPNSFKKGMRVRFKIGTPEGNRTFEDDEGNNFIIEYTEVGTVSEDPDPNFSDVSVIFPKRGEIPLICYDEDLESLDPPPTILQERFGE